MTPLAEPDLRRLAAEAVARPRCAGAFLQYTEYGGYYEDERIRPLQAGLIVDTPAA